jgi:hypothetical protein
MLTTAGTSAEPTVPRQESSAKAGSATRDTAHWYVQPYAAMGTYNGIVELAVGPLDGWDLEPAEAYFAAFSGGRILWRGDALRVSAEATVARHIGYNRFTELSTAVMGRWDLLPWDRFFPSSISFGEGISYTTEVPGLERRKNDEVARFLNLLIWELAYHPRDRPRWDVYGRIHHRSGVWGTYSGVTAGSNFLGLGVRYYIP